MSSLTTTDAPTTSGSPPPRTVASRHVGRWVTAAVVLVLMFVALVALGDVSL